MYQQNKRTTKSEKVNLIKLSADVHKRDLHMIHFMAWKKGVKSLYYCRSKSMQRAETAVGVSAGMSDAQPAANDQAQVDTQVAGSEEANKYDECLSCQ